MRQKRFRLSMKMTTKEVLTISKTNDLRKLIQELLEKTTAQVYYKKADRDAIYPHIVHVIDRTSRVAEHRDDVSVTVDVWAKSEGRAIELADLVEEEFDRKNLPQETILPTFFFETRNNVKDEDDSISHIQLVFNVQNYER